MTKAVVNVMAALMIYTRACVSFTTAVVSETNAGVSFTTVSDSSRDEDVNPKAFPIPPHRTHQW
jgi:hypothetical protein